MSLVCAVWARWAHAAGALTCGGRREEGRAAAASTTFLPCRSEPKVLVCVGFAAQCYFKGLCFMLPHSECYWIPSHRKARICFSN